MGENIDAPEPHPYDCCECGDYRHQHVNGRGACRLGSLCTPGRCQQFRFLHGPSAEDRTRRPPEDWGRKPIPARAAAIPVREIE